MIESLKKELKEFEIKSIKEEDYNDLYELERNNIQYFKYTKEEPDYTSIIEEVHELPPNITKDNKYFVGFYKDKTLIAIMDLIDGYPNKEIYWIGLFMIDVNYHKQGIGTKIISTMIKHTQKNIQLGCLSNNKEGDAFWSKMGFKEIRIAYNEEKDWEIIVMEKQNTLR